MERKSFILLLATLLLLPVSCVSNPVSQPKTLGQPFIVAEDVNSGRSNDSEILFSRIVKEKAADATLRFEIFSTSLRGEGTRSLTLTELFPWRWSPSGDAIVMINNRDVQEASLQVMQYDQGILTTEPIVVDVDPQVWSYDGQQILCIQTVTTTPEAQWEFVILNRSGELVRQSTGTQTRLIQTVQQWATSWGGTAAEIPFSYGLIGNLLFMEAGGRKQDETRVSLFRANLNSGDIATIPVLSAGVGQLVVSPDGKNFLFQPENDVNRHTFYSMLQSMTENTVSSTLSTTTNPPICIWFQDGQKVFFFERQEVTTPTMPGSTSQTPTLQLVRYNLKNRERTILHQNLPGTRVVNSSELFITHDVLYYVDSEGTLWGLPIE